MAIRLRFLTSISGIGFNCMPRDERDWADEAEAKRFIAAGYAEEIKPAPAEKRARTVETPESAAPAKETAESKTAETPEGEDAPGDETADQVETPDAKAGKGGKKGGGKGKG